MMREVFAWLVVAVCGAVNVYLLKKDGLATILKGLSPFGQVACIVPYLLLTLGALGIAYCLLGLGGRMSELYAIGLPAVGLANVYAMLMVRQRFF